MSKGVQVAVGASVIGLLLAWYAVSQLESGASFTYFQDLASFRAVAGSQVGRHSRVHGYVALGSIERDVAAREVRFAVVGEPPHAGASDGVPMAVVYAGLETPDLFKDGAEVVVEGVLTGAGPDGLFRADKVMAKCPSKFEADPTRQASF